MNESGIHMITKDTVTSVSICGPMTIDKIGELRDGLLKAFDVGQKVELSLQEVTDLDLTGLQLLCSAHRTAIAGHLSFSIVGRDGAAVLPVVTSSGMLRHVGCAEDTEGTCVWKKEA
jgi:ABC-type transporter Mla MlaB component